MNELEYYLHEWNLSQPFQLFSTPTSRIYKVTRHQQDAILKHLTPVGRQFEALSSQALEAFGGDGAVRVLTYDKGALLLEFIEGPSLTSVVEDGRDRQASEIICNILDKLHASPFTPTSEFPTLKQQFQSLFNRAAKAGAPEIFLKTAQVANELLNSEGHKALLHGDIHHFNILQSKHRGWLAIDPQPLYGERTYDVANAFFNPDNLPSIVETEQRVRDMASLFSQRLQVTEQRVLKFAFAHGGLSSSWQLDDGEDPARRLRITDLLEKLIFDAPK